MEGIVGLPFDVVLVVALLACCLVFNYTVGRNRAATLLIALYTAAAIFMLMPVVDVAHEVVSVDARVLPLVLFTLLLALAYAVFSRNAFFDPYVVPNGWERALFAVLHAALLIVILVSIESSAATTAFSPNFSRIFLDPLVRSGIVIAPIVVLAFFRGTD